MKILIDQNISFRLIQKIEATFPDITHVKYCNLSDANDFEIFIYAKNNQFKAILTLDEDFDNILLEHKAPPKVIWLRIGNTSTATLAEIMLQNADTIFDFLDDDDYDCLEIFE